MHANLVFVHDTLNLYISDFVLFVVMCCQPSRLSLVTWISQNIQESVP